MSVVTTQPTFTPVKLRKGLEPVDGFDIHFGETPPVPVPGYRLVRGALVGSGPSPMSVQLGDDIIDDLSTMFSFRGGTRANNALPPEQLMYAIMLYPGLGELARELMRQFPDVTATSREGFGPVWHLWAAAAAIQTSNVGLDTLLGSGDTFERLADIAVRVHGWDVAWQLQ